MRKIFAIFGSKFILRFTYSTKNARIQKIVNELGFALFSLNFLDSDTCQIFKSELLHLCFSHFKRAKNKQNVKRHQNLSKFWLANPNQGKSKFWRLKLGGLAKSLVWPAPNCKAKSAFVCVITPHDRQNPSPPGCGQPFEDIWPQPGPLARGPTARVFMPWYAQIPL